MELTTSHSRRSISMGLQGFAIDLAFQTANSDPGRFGPGESVTFDLDASAALTASQFNNLVAGNGRRLLRSGHVNSVAATGNCGAGSAKIGDLTAEMLRRRERHQLRWPRSR